MHRLSRTSWIAPLLGSALAACGSDGGGSGPTGGAALSAQTAASFEGVYAMTELTRNDTGCDAEGPSALAEANETHLVAVSQAVLGQDSLQVLSCLDVADCQSKADAIRQMSGTAASFILRFTSEQSTDAISGFEATTGFERNGTCEERTYTDHAMTRTGDTITVESREKALPDRPAEDGFCVVSTNEAAKEAESVPCSSLRVIAAERVADLQ